LDFSGTEADRIITDAFSMHPELLVFRDHRVDAVEQTLVGVFPASTDASP
jgi:hypothetical protein